MTTETLLGTAEWLAPDGARTAPLTSALLEERIFDAAPFRTGNAYPRQRNYHGHYFFSSTGTHVWHESLLERDVLRLLDHAGDVFKVATQPMSLTMGDRVHVPDILVMHSDGAQTLIDVKPSSRLDVRALEQFETTETVCRQVGWNYRVMTESSPQVRLNLEYLAQFRGTEYDLPAAAEALAHHQAGWTLGDLVAAVPGATTAQARAVALGMLWHRDLVVDLRQRLTEQSPVSVPNAHGLEAVDAIQQ